MISDASPLGALQVPASGQPILLMADRQTTGGYPKIATVISADIGLAGQLGPGDTIAFAICTRQEALAALDRAGTRADGAGAVGPAPMTRLKRPMSEFEQTLGVETFGPRSRCRSMRRSRR